VTDQKKLWRGVYPAATTQFHADGSIDFDATQRVLSALVDDGVDGLILLGTCGENNSLDAAEKLAVLRAGVEAVGGCVPLVAGVSEFTTRSAIAYARNAEAIGLDALMVLPAMVYVPTAVELAAHFRAVAEATALPIMLYNNPPAYRVNVDFTTLEALRPVKNVVAIKESAPDTRRFTDLFNRFGDRYSVMAGLDDVALEGLMLGASGWVSGLTSAFPQELPRIIAATWRRRGVSIAGSCRCFIWMQNMILCSRSSWLKRSWAGVRNVCACRVSRCPANAGPMS
jgi:1-pyrroline-4-hydroxy-2-carboxylate deaminase